MKAQNGDVEPTNAEEEQQPKVVIKQVDPKVAAAELSQQVEQIKKSVERIEEAKVVRKQLLDKEVSI